MGILDSVKEKISDHHEQQKTSIDHSHNDGLDPRKSDTQNWVTKGQGGDRSDDHGIRAGSLTNPDTNSALHDPKVHEAVMNDKDRVGSISQ